MAGLKVIKTKIRSIEKTQTVTKAMEAVSAAKMRKSQLRALSGRTYARSAVSILARVSGVQDVAQNPLLAKRPVRHALYVVITSDKGLAGSVNSAVLRRVSADIASEGYTTDMVSVIAVGRKAYDYFMARGFTIEAFHPNNDLVTASIIDTIVSESASRFSLGATDIVKVAYQNFISTFEQRPTLHTVFPLSLSELQSVVHDIIPARGTFSSTAVEVEPANYEIEPSQEEVLGALLPRLASIFVYFALLESQASEHSARMVSMKSASDKAEEMEHALTLQFNKARQAAITREVSEITGGMEAMATQ